MQQHILYKPPLYIAQNIVEVRIFETCIFKLILEVVPFLKSSHIKVSVFICI